MDEKKSKDEEKSVKQIILEYIQHNPQHYIKLNIFKKTLYPCARCFGLCIGLLMGVLFSSPFWLGLVYVSVSNFALMFVISWLFVVPAIIDWSTVKLKLRKGKNSIRVITGFLYAIGITVYLFVLPANIIFKIVTYLSYEAIFYLIRWKYHIDHYELGN